MSNVDIDLAIKDELPQTFTTQDVEDIKSAIDVPRANVTILNTVYSPEETKIGVWREYRTVEGEQVLMEKPLYGNAVVFPSITIPTTNYDFGDISSMHIDRGWIVNATMDESNYLIGYGTLSIWLRIPNNTFGGKSLDFSRTGELRIILQYTKTTDSWQEVVE